MRDRMIKISLLFSVIIAALSGLLYLESRRGDRQDIQSRHMIEANELEQLAKQGEMELVSEKAAALQESIRSSEGGPAGEKGYLLIGAVCVLYTFFLFFYIYFSILKPFDKMKVFAKEIAQGNFDVPLGYERSNYFGHFTWAFDSMRTEITKSRSCEKEAIENNKTVIATLSHDIKTPIASIRAYAEGLEANMDRSAGKRQKYISVIMKKCDEVSGLTNDLFLHSISDLDKLKITMEEFALCEFLREAVSEISAEHNDVRLTLPEEEVMISADRNRLTQVCENLINNARKYAKTRIDISAAVKDGCAQISFRDYGRGIPDEDMPFIFSKFYRGKNCSGEQGSGLGLYIVKYIVEKLGGNVLLHNDTKGFTAVIFLPLETASLRTS